MITKDRTDGICTVPCPPQEEHNIYTEGINYFDPTVSPKTIWGPGDRDVLRYLDDHEFKGRWLNLASGDGRYSNELLRKADEVVAADLDRSATSKLVHNTPPELREKLEVMNFNLTTRFPVEDGLFDGIFCTGVLHLFPKRVLPRVLDEMRRVVAHGGHMFFDFATDIQRRFMDGSPYPKRNEAAYSYGEAVVYIGKLLSGYEMAMERSEVPEEVVKIADRIYTFKSRLILVTAWVNEWQTAQR